MRIPLARYGLRELLLATSVLGAAAAAVLLGYPWASLGCAAVWLAVLAFFRDPPRRIPADATAIVAPADGRVTEIAELQDCEVVGGPAWRIGIFLSIFDVHINRAPCGGRVAEVVYRPGRFLDARDPDSGRLNESNTIVIEADDPLASRVAVKQIAGLVARRIVCRCRPGDRLAAGEPFGMIKFGSRTELYLPRRQDVQLLVQVGDRVKAGSTVLGRARAGIPQEETAYAAPA